MDKVAIYRVLWSTLKLDATNRHGLADVITLEDHRRALDAVQEKVKRLSTCGTDHSTPWWQVKCEDLEAQLATLQAQLRQAEGQSQQQAEEAVIVFAKYTTLRQLVEVHTKQLTELTIIPIGCSREQELRWTQSIKDLRAALADVDAALQPERGRND